MEAASIWYPIQRADQRSDSATETWPTHRDETQLVGVVPAEAEWSDDELMRAVASREARALEVLYDRHVRGCFGLAMKIVRDPLVAEEVVQDVFMKVWSAPSSFSPERGKFSGWLLTLVHNRSIDKLRRLRSRGRESTMPLDTGGDAEVEAVGLVADAGPGPDEQAWREERRQILRRFLDNLPEPQRQALTLAYFEGLTQREIAERLRQPVGTVKTRTRAALMQMRRLLAGQELMGEL